MIDIGSEEIRRKLMKEVGGGEKVMMEENENGEDVVLDVSSDEIIQLTFQKNGWVRRNYYNAEGRAVEENFRGVWRR